MTGQGDRRRFILNAAFGWKHEADEPAQSTRAQHSLLLQHWKTRVVLRWTLISLLGVSALFAPRSCASVVSVTFENYLRVEAEFNRSAPKTPDDLASDQLVRALGGVGASWYRLRERSQNNGVYVFAHLMHHSWIADNIYQHRPTTVQQVMETASEWMCTCIADSVLVSTMGANAERWLDADGDGLEDEASHQALALEIKDAIARFHEETQVEIALAVGKDNEAARAKYMELVAACPPEYA